MRSFTFVPYLLFFSSLFAVTPALPEPVDDGTREVIARGGWHDKCWEKHGWNKCGDNHCCQEKQTCCGKHCCQYGEYCVKYNWDWKCCKNKDCKKW